MLITALAFSLASATTPAWIDEWLKWPLPEESSEGRLQQAVRGRSQPASWATESAAPLVIHVIDADTGKAVNEALLASWQDRQLAFTDKTGTAKPKLWYGDSKNAYVAALAPGYRAGSDHAPIVDGHVYVALRKDPNLRAYGVVIGPDGLPAKGVRVGPSPMTATRDAVGRRGPAVFGGTAHRVLADHDSDDGDASVATDALGRFALIAPPGMQKIVASVPNNGFAEAAAPASAKPVTLTLEPKGGIEVSGVVVDDKGQPIRGIEIEDEYSSARVVTGSDGRFHFNHCAQGLFYFDVDGAESIYLGASAYEGKDLGKLKVVVESAKAEALTKAARERRAVRDR